MTRLHPLVKVAAAGAFAIVIGESYLGLSKPCYDYIKKKARQSRRILFKSFQRKEVDDYVYFQALPFVSIQSRRAFRELKHKLVRKKQIPKNLDVLAESLTDEQAKRLSCLIGPDLALNVAFAITKFGTKSIANLIYSGRPINNRIEKRMENHIVPPGSKEECIRFIENGGLDQLLQSRSDKLRMILALTYFVPNRQVFYHTGWIHQLAEYLCGPPEMIQQTVEALACMENLRTESGQFSSRLVLPLHLPNDAQPIVDLVFIHGAWGSCYHTWRQDSCPEAEVVGVKQSLITRLVKLIAQSNVQEYQRCSCWPRYWLPQDLVGSVRILAVNYSSEQAQSLVGLADTIRCGLLDCGVGKRPVIWISHSMGGLLVKHLSIMKEFESNSAGFVFYSVPHHGVQLINENISIIAPFLEHFSTRKRKDLEDLHERWLNVVRSSHLPVLSFVEKIPLRLPPSTIERVIVEKKSAYPNVGEFYTMIQKDHVNVCKPYSKDSADYQIVLQFLNNVIRDAQARSEPCLIPEWAVGEQCALGPEYIVVDSDEGDLFDSVESLPASTRIPSFAGTL